MLVFRAVKAGLREVALVGIVMLIAIPPLYFLGVLSTGLFSGLYNWLFNPLDLGHILFALGGLIITFVTFIFICILSQLKGN